MEGLLKNVLTALVETLDESSNKKRDVSKEAYWAQIQQEKQDALEKRIKEAAKALEAKAKKEEAAIKEAEEKHFEESEKNDHGLMGTENMLGKGGEGEEDFKPENSDDLVYNEENKLVVSGKYFGEDFKSGKPELAVVDGSMYLDGCKEFNATFIFNSTRIETDKKGKECNKRFIEELTITSDKGRCIAIADYFDCGAGADDKDAADILSGDGSAIYHIIAGTGELDSLEGHGLEIYFNNDKSKRRPRNIVLRKSESGDKASCFNYTKALSGKIR